MKEKTFMELAEWLKGEVIGGRMNLEQATRHLHDSATARGVGITEQGCQEMLRSRNLVEEAE